MDGSWFKPWVGGVKRITLPLTGFDTSPDGRWIALWGRAGTGVARGPDSVVHCVDVSTGESGCSLSGEGTIIDLRFVSPDEVWVLREGHTPGVGVVTAHAVPDGGELDRWVLIGVSTAARMQVAAGGARVLVADALGRWQSADDRNAVYWHLLDSRSRAVVSRLDPHAIWAWSYEREDVVDLAPWSAMRPSLCPDGQHVAVRVDTWRRGHREGGALVLLDGLDRRGVTFPGKVAPEGLSLAWLGPTQIAECAITEGAAFSLLLTDGGSDYTARTLPVIAEDARGRWDPERAEVSVSPDGRRLLVTASRYAAGPGRYGITSLDGRAREMTLQTLPESHPRNFTAAWFDDTTLAVVLGGSSAERTRVVRYHPDERTVLGARTLPTGSGADLFRLRRSQDRQWLVLDWYDPAMEGWQLALVPAVGLLSGGRPPSLP